MKLEICIDRLESALAAVSGGADRIEVCGALCLGGITPSFGLVEQCVALEGARVMMMIRPHAGGFCYQADELRTMLQDIQVAKKVGVHGVVFGALEADGNVDREVCKRLIEAARPLSITFHRAFDLALDPFLALETLLGLGVDRLLTSGQAASAVEGADLICKLVQRCGNSLAVIAGAGVRSKQIASLVQATGVNEIHASASEIEPDTSGLGIVHSTRITRAAMVREMVNAIRSIDSAKVPKGPSTD